MIRRMKFLLEIHQEKKKAAVVEEKNPEFQTEMESTKISPGSRKTPTEPIDVISGLSLENGSKDSELSWVGTALEDEPRLPAG